MCYNDTGLCAKNVRTVIIIGLIINTIRRADVIYYNSTLIMKFEMIFQIFVISNDYLDKTIFEPIQQPKAYVKLGLPTVSPHSCLLSFTMNTMPVPDVSHVALLCNYNHGRVMIPLFFFFLFFSCFFFVMTNLQWVQHIHFIISVMKSIKHPRVPSTSARGSTFS